MSITFACPSCGASGSVADSLVGRNVRCKHCTHRFAVPELGAADAEGYGLAEPPRRAAAAVPPGMTPTPVYIAARGAEMSAVHSPRKPGKARPRPTKRRHEPGFAWTPRLTRGGAALAIFLLAIALIAPQGVVIAGSVLILAGMVMIWAGYAVGAYGAFSEDFLYGFLYLVLPLYSAYYIITRWTDMKRWIIISTAGVGLVLIGGEMLQWSGVAE